LYNIFYTRLEEDDVLVVVFADGGMKPLVERLQIL
jgi:hypothetical protein